MEEESFWINNKRVMLVGMSRWVVREVYSVLSIVGEIFKTPSPSVLSYPLMGSFKQGRGWRLIPCKSIICKQTGMEKMYKLSFYIRKSILINTKSTSKMHLAWCSTPTDSLFSFSFIWRAISFHHPQPLDFCKCVWMCLCLSGCLWVVLIIEGCFAEFLYANIP